MSDGKKRLDIVCTSKFEDKYGGFEAQTVYEPIARKLFREHKCDMLVFEYDSNLENMTVRLAGFNFEDPSNSEEMSGIVYEAGSMPIETFWFKVDDYGDRYIGTFLFPDEY